MTQTNKFHALEALRQRRLSLERTSTDPAGWLDLADAYEKIGALSNAASCRARAEYYALEQEREAVSVTSQPSLFDVSAIPPLCQRCEKQTAAHVVEFIPPLRRDGTPAGDTLAFAWAWYPGYPIRPPMIAVCEGCKEKIVNATL